MRAITFNQQLTFHDNHPDPTPTDGECLIRVHLAGICSTDLQITKGYMGFRGILGHEFVGTVERGTPNWQGKRVACEINCVCRHCDMCQAGLANHCRNRTVIGIAGRDGAFADLITVPEANLHAVPDSISDEQAVFIEPLAAAWQVVKQTAIDEHSRVAVVGSGRLGLLIAQVLRTIDCRLTVLGRNPKTLLFCDKKHIQSVHVDEWVARGDHDVVVECTGSPDGMAIAQATVRPRGVIVLKSTYAGGSNIDWAPVVINEVNVIGSRCGPFADAIASLERGEIDVNSMISGSLTIERGIEAMELAAQPDHIKVLLKVNPAS